ncbi:MAG: hypothetical protein ACYC27_02595 [Armatimonadota bacterium]
MRYLVCALLFTLSLSNAAYAADAPGTVVFVKLSGDAYDARSNVYEQKLTGGDAKKIINFLELPKEFIGRIDRVLPSSDGSLLLLKESNINIIRNRTTGTTRKVFGSEYSTIGNEVQIKEIKGSCWIWSRADGKIRKIDISSPTNDVGPISWSPKGKLLLLNVRNTKTMNESIYLYDASTRKTKFLRASGILLFAMWTPDNSSILVGEESNTAATKLSLLSLSGKAKSIKTRSRRIFTAAVSPDGNKVAIGDTGGFYIIDIKKQTQGKLAIPVSEGWLDGNAEFSVDGKTLALLSSSTSSGVYAEVDESLWIIDISTLKASLLKRWSTTLGNSPGEDETHRLIGWIPKQPALFVMGRSCTLQGAETYWRKLWYISVDSTQPDRKISDTGSYGIDMSVWSK